MPEVLAQIAGKLPGAESLPMWLVFLFLVIKESISQVARKKNGKNGNGAPLGAVVYRDHEAHTKALQDISKVLASQTEVLRTMKDEMCGTHRQMSRELVQINTKMGKD